MPEYIFIIGAARSGTKFLRDVIGAGSDISVVPYDINYVWRYGQEASDHDELSPDMLSRKQKKFIREAIVLQSDQREGSEFIVEKTVSNTLRIPLVNDLFPTSRFIHLIRDGRDVTESAYRQWRTPPDWRYLLSKVRGFPWRNVRYALWFLNNQFKNRKEGRAPVWGPRYRAIEDDVLTEPPIKLCARQWVRCIEAAHADLASLPSYRTIQVRYEDLTSNVTEMERIIDFIGLKDKESVLTEYRIACRPNLQGRWRTSLDEREREIMLEEVGKTLAKFCY